MQKYAFLTALWLIFAFVFVCLLQVASAYADDPTTTTAATAAAPTQAADVAQSCTTGPTGVTVCPERVGIPCTSGNRSTDEVMGRSNVLHDILKAIKTILNNVAQKFYDDALPKLAGAITAMFVLYIVSYGLLIMFQIVPLAYGEIFPRLLKMGIVLLLLSKWAVFYQYIGLPILTTMDTLIENFLSVALDPATTKITSFSGAAGIDATTGQAMTTAPADVGASSDTIIALLQSPFSWIITTRFFTMIYSLFFSSFLGFFLSIILMFTLYNLIKIIIAGFFNYLRAIVVLFFLFGIAPIFILMILFEETRRKLFQGWINQVVSIVFQPVMFFAFIAFFFVMINTTMQNLLYNFEACETTVHWITNKPMQITRPNQRNLITYKMESDNGDRGTKPPIDIMTVLLVWLLTEITWRFTKYIEQLGADISQGSVDIVIKMTSKGRDVSNAVKGVFKP